MTHSFSFIRLHTTRRVAWLEFDRPPVNAFNRQMVEDVHAGIATALADPGVRVLVVASALERYFSAGADLREFEGLNGPAMRDWVCLCHEIARQLRASPPLLAAIQERLSAAASRLPCIAISGSRPPMPSWVSPKFASASFRRLPRPRPWRA
jgi:enoyl-CoA hydratase/carnithine racemase